MTGPESFLSDEATATPESEFIRSTAEFEGKFRPGALVSPQEVLDFIESGASYDENDFSAPVLKVLAPSLKALLNTIKKDEIFKPQHVVVLSYLLLLYRDPFDAASMMSAQGNKEFLQRQRDINNARKNLNMLRDMVDWDTIDSVKFGGEEGLTIAVEKTDPNLKSLQQFLLDGFTPNEIKTFIFDELGKDVLDELPKDISNSQFIRRALEIAVLDRTLNNLINRAAQENTNKAAVYNVQGALEALNKQAQKQNQE